MPAPAGLGVTELTEISLQNRLIEDDFVNRCNFRASVVVLTSKLNSVCRCLSSACRGEVKRETGERPVLSRNCKWPEGSHEPGDLPADGTSEATMHGHKTYEGSAHMSRLPCIVLSVGCFRAKTAFSMGFSGSVSGEICFRSHFNCFIVIIKEAL